MKEKKVAEKAELVLGAEAQVLWDQVKDLPTEFFGLKHITVKDVATPVNLDPTRLFLKLKASAALVSVEDAVSQLLVKSKFGDMLPKFTVEAVRDMAVVAVNPEL